MTPDEDILLANLLYNPSPIIKFAARMHIGQVDKAGKPYIFHPMRVAHRVAVRGGSFHQVAAAWFHDVVEDTEATMEDLERFIYGAGLRYVAALTHRPNEPRKLYIARIVEAGAGSIKEADIEDNSDPQRLRYLTPATQDRLNKKYRRDLAQIRAARSVAGSDPSTHPAHQTQRSSPVGERLRRLYLP